MPNLPGYMFISSVDGALHDTRDSCWSSRPLRENYCRTYGAIESVADLKATLRAGEHAWPGGYPLYFVTADGAALSFDSARKEFRQIADSISHGWSDGWRIVASAINYEDSELFCDHSGERIPAAYEKES